MALSVASINANGLRNDNKRLAFLQWLSHLSFDFVCLQATHVLSDFEAQTWFSSYGFISLASSGTVVLYRPVISLLDSKCDQYGRLVAANVSLCGKSFGVVSLYTTNVNPDRDTFFDIVASFVDPDKPTFLCGDFNNNNNNNNNNTLFIWRYFYCYPIALYNDSKNILPIKIKIKIKKET